MRHDPDRFGEALTAQAGMLRRYAWRLTRDGDQARDLLQETLLRGWQARESFAPGTNLGAWLSRIMRNAFLSGLRVQARFVRDPDGAIAGARSIDAAQEAAVLLGQLGEALARRPASHVDALIRIVGGESYRETSHTLGVRVGTLKSRVSRVRAALEQDFAPWPALARSTGAGA